MFRKAVKLDSKLRLALCGPAGSGKTYNLFAIATGLGGGIAFMDTEHGSASKYAHLFASDVVEPAEFDPGDAAGQAEVQALLDRMGSSKIEVQRALKELHRNLVEAAGFDGAGEVYKRVGAQYPIGIGKDPIRIGHVRRTVWELWKAAQEEKEKAAQAARREGERVLGGRAHGV